MKLSKQAFQKKLFSKLTKSQIKDHRSELDKIVLKYNNSNNLGVYTLYSTNDGGIYTTCIGTYIAYTEEHAWLQYCILLNTGIIDMLFSGFYNIKKSKQSARNYVLSLRKSIKKEIEEKAKQLKEIADLLVEIDDG